MYLKCYYFQNFTHKKVSICLICESYHGNYSYPEVWGQNVQLLRVYAIKIVFIAITHIKFDYHCLPCVIKFLKIPGINTYKSKDLNLSCFRCRGNQTTPYFLATPGVKGFIRCTYIWKIRKFTNFFLDVLQGYDRNQVEFHLKIFWLDTIVHAF